nr:DUF4276 family protein [Deinococcus aestuarii]
MTTYARARSDVLQWLRQDTGAHVTTFFDLYALPTDFPRRAAATGAPSGAARATLLEEAFARDIGSPLFFPHIQPHEFEALLFSDVAAIDRALQLLMPVSRLSNLTTMLTSLPTPEDLNDSPSTAPSKRLLGLYPAYDKRLFGPLIAAEIGLTRMRQACPHFGAWLTRLESLS